MPAVIGLVLLLNINGELMAEPNTFAFVDMSQCQAAREELKVYANENLIEGTVQMACIPAEAFQ